MEHVFPVFWGEFGRNGKGTLFETLGYVLVSNLEMSGRDALTVEKRSEQRGPRADIMALRGRRLCWASETDQNRRLSVALVKELAGGHALRTQPTRKTPSFFSSNTHYLFVDQ